MSHSLIVDQLVAWCHEHDVNLDPRLEIQWNRETGIAVFAGNAIPVCASEKVAQINKKSVLSTRNCTLSSEINPALAGPEALYHLSLAVYSEILLGSESRWYGYLQSLPEGIVDLPLFWSCYFSETDAEDKHLALQWSEGTEVAKYTGRRVIAIKEYFYQEAEPRLRARFGQRAPITVEGFFRAYSLVSSRSFLVDAFHGLAMVPIADAFNHSHENHVHIETDFSVCSECGSLTRCAHDEDDRSQPKDPAEPPDPLDPYYEMVTCRPIAPGTEVFNTYGENLSNAQLLGRYGFIIEDNDNDLLTWEFEQLFECMHPQLEAHNEYRLASMTRLHDIWSSSLQRASHSGFLTELAASELVNVDQSNGGSDLYLNSDGRISHSLWVLLSVFSLIETLPAGEVAPVEDVMKAIRSILDYQLILEAGDHPPAGDSIQSLAFDRLASLAVKMCEVRRRKLLREGDDGMVTASVDLNEILDGLAPSMHRTKSVLLIAIGECSLLESCEAMWRDLVGLDQDFDSPPR